jgi:hypothetical protein
MLGAWFLLPVNGPFYAIIAFITAILTIAIYPGEWGSLWCFMANLLPVLQLILNR